MDQYISLLIIKPHAVRDGLVEGVQEIIHNLDNSELVESLNLTLYVKPRVGNLKFSGEFKRDLADPKYAEVISAFYEGDIYGKNWLQALIQVMQGEVIVMIIAGDKSKFVDYADFIRVVKGLKGRPAEIGSQTVEGRGIRGKLMSPAMFADFSDAQVKHQSEEMPYEQYFETYQDRIVNVIHTTDTEKETQKVLNGLFDAEEIDSLFK